jgi:hypothetical protein
MYGLRMSAENARCPSASMPRQSVVSGAGVPVVTKPRRLNPVSSSSNACRCAAPKKARISRRERLLASVNVS